MGEKGNLSGAHPDHTHTTRDLVSGLVCAGFGLLFCIGSIRYGDVRKGIPSAGFFPCLGGVALIVLSLVEIASALTRRRGPAMPPGTSDAGGASPATARHSPPATAFFPQRDSARRLLLALAGLVAYGFTLEYLGLLLTTFLFVLFVMKCIEPQRWPVTLAMAVATSAASWVIFDLWLKIELPKGVLRAYLGF